MLYSGRAHEEGQLRVAVISDVHSNLPALEAVLKELGSFDQLWCLGDLVGYGPFPNECVDLVRSYDPVCIPGNHDWGATGRIPLDDFNYDALRALQWTTAQLSPTTRAFLDELSPVQVSGEFTLAHGSPREPIWEYVLSREAARASFRHFSTQFCLVGHTHVPLIFGLGEDGTLRAQHMPDGSVISLGPDRLMVNPGSVGQPRDGDPRAGYVLYDTDADTLHWRRAQYSVSHVQDTMADVGLPPALAARLAHGW